MTGSNLIAPTEVSLLSIHYDLLAWEKPPVKGGAVDSVSTSVTLCFERDMRLTLRWRVHQEFECLSASKAGKLDPTPMTRREDVSTRWEKLISARVTGQSVSYQTTEWGVQPWALAIEFNHVHHLVVALGEVNLAGEITYIPDALVVSDQKRIMSNYRPPAALSSAWS